MSFGIYMFLQDNMRKHTKMCIPEDVFKQNRSKAHPNFRLGPEYHHDRGPGPPRSPHAKGGGQACGLGGVVAPPPAPPGPTFLWRCTQCIERRLHAVFPKIPEQTDHPQAIKGGPSSHLRGSYIFWRR